MVGRIGQDTTAPPGGTRAPEDQARVAAFGDSLMWGQGLNRGDRFTSLITRALPGILGRDGSTVSHDLSRSGAQIRARAEQRSEFPVIFPALFQTASERTSFRRGTDETPATRLYGEIPSTFPTIRGQVDLISAALGRTIDVALVDGGINDIGPETVVSPANSPGEYIERFDGQIRAIAHDDVLELLGRVRRKCPKAIILYFGFFPLVSYASSTSDLRDAIKYEIDDDFGWFVNSIFGCRDVNAAILETMTRAVFLQGRWQYWSRQAVADANDDEDLRGNGIIFVPSGFEADNAGFAPTPFVNEDYRDPTSDPAQPERRRRCPRINELAALDQLYFLLLSTPLAASLSVDFRDVVQTVHDSIDGPNRLIGAMQGYIGDPNPRTAGRLAENLRTEISRIRRALIASVAHPNAAGARSYANNAIRRLREHAALTQQVAQEMSAGPIVTAPLAGAPETLDARMRRYRLRGSGSLAAAVGHLDVDSLAVRVVNGRSSDQNFYPDVFLIVSTRDASGSARRRYQLNFTYYVEDLPSTPVSTRVTKPYPHFEPGATNRFTIDTEGRLRLDEIVSCHLHVERDPYARKRMVATPGQVWRPDQVRLEVNGRQVVSLDLAGQQFTFGDTIDLDYPAPEPNFAPPAMAHTTIARVRSLGATPNAERALAPLRLAETVVPAGQSG